jgi:hypothetical protein
LAATVLTLALTVIVAGTAWLLLGSRLGLSADPRQNDVFNFLSYAALTLPLALVLVAFVLERL